MFSSLSLPGFAALARDELRSLCLIHAVYGFGNPEPLKAFLNQCYAALRVWVPKVFSAFARGKRAEAGACDDVLVLLLVVTALVVG